MNAVIIFLFFILGASLGSFAAATWIRISKGQSLQGRSLCCACGKKLRIRDNVPIFSWIFLRGKSACCAEPIPSFYFWVELTFALAFTLAAAFILFS